jgi:S1-C subfamily serine protease
MSLKKTVFAGSVLALGVVGGLVLSGRMAVTQPSVASQIEGGAQSRPPVPAPAAGLPDLSSVAERALRVAANITSTSIIRPPDDPLYRFFYGGLAQSSQSLGSGVVVDPNGIILTNRHVVQNTNAQIRVTLPDGREVPGRAIGMDEVSDLAVLRVDAKNLPTLPWGDSSQLRVAEWVLAIGNPFQLSGTVTLGIVSTVNRSGAQVGAYSDFIQTDAAINPGNSGGALVNSRGELVGINTMIYSETGGNQGIGFAIPSNTAQRIMKSLIEQGQVVWGSIGNVQWYDLSRAAAQELGIGDVSGVLVYRIYQDSSAYRSGLRPGDIVVAINGTAVSDSGQLTRAIVNAKVGELVKLDVVRQDRRIVVNVPVVNRQSRATTIR